MQIRPATVIDAEPVTELLTQLGYPQDDVEATASRIQLWTDDPAAAALVADADGKVLGVIAVRTYPFFQLPGYSGHVVALVVSDHARRRGVASRLLSAAEAFALEHGCTRMEITSADRRNDAHAFYQRRGYTIQTGLSSRFLREL
jgi:GNAT superfamily N-acetyltransferase